jgi:hypothetical protein
MVVGMWRVDFVPEMCLLTRFAVVARLTGRKQNTIEPARARDDV